jgi:hypothetical protein
MPNINRSTTQAHDGQVIVGIKKDLQSVPSLALGGSTYTPAALTQLIQSRIDAVNTVANAKAQWHDAVTTYAALNSRVTQVVRDLRQYVINASGPDSPVLADYGFTAPKRTPLTPQQKVAKAALAAATRKARGTLGKKQKLAIKGAVPPTPATQGTATAPTVAAAPVLATPVAAPVTAAPGTLTAAPAASGVTTPHA